MNSIRYLCCISFALSPRTPSCLGSLQSPAQSERVQRSLVHTIPFAPPSASLFSSLLTWSLDAWPGDGCALMALMVPGPVAFGQW